MRPVAEGPHRRFGAEVGLRFKHPPGRPGARCGLGVGLGQRKGRPQRLAICLGPQPVAGRLLAVTCGVRTIGGRARTALARGRAVGRCTPALIGRAHHDLSAGDGALLAMFSPGIAGGQLAIL